MPCPSLLTFWASKNADIPGSIAPAAHAGLQRLLRLPLKRRMNRSSWAIEVIMAAT